MTREDAISGLKEIREWRGLPYCIEEPLGKQGVAVISTEMIDMAIKALKQEPCEDCISRQAVLDLAKKGVLISNGNYESVCKAINELPSVNPQPKTGHWIQTNEFFINQDGQFIYKFICSECKSLSYFRKSNKKAIGANVCPDCGAKMVEPQESEDKDADSETF